ncbi:hypothetical protein [Aurantimonas sp. 22II-16-19i]|nr:hypothetical protein [Aurantimonas sp. 22II-16-19i]ORE91422.1 hypothetical protein ATO4_18869 [Aurantimonas sp. 22II-16-19i]
MTGTNLIMSMIRTVTEFFRPSYRPERHYMRGPGPACARKSRGPLAV